MKLSIDDNDNELGYDADEYNYEEGFMLNQDTVFELAEPGIIFGMRSPPNAIESFYVAEVMDKGVSENNMIDENGHNIMSAELYLEERYLQKEAQKKKGVQYQRQKKLHHILIHVAEVFITNITLDADLCMDISEYQIHSECCYLIYFTAPYGIKT